MINSMLETSFQICRTADIFHRERTNNNDTLGVKYDMVKVQRRAKSWRFRELTMRPTELSWNSLHMLLRQANRRPIIKNSVTNTICEERVAKGIC